MVESSLSGSEKTNGILFYLLVCVHFCQELFHLQPSIVTFRTKPRNCTIAYFYFSLETGSWMKLSKKKKKKKKNSYKALRLCISNGVVLSCSKMCLQKIVVLSAVGLSSSQFTCETSFIVRSLTAVRSGPFRTVG